MKMYYVIGISDTRGEFYPRGVTGSKIKAEKFKLNLAKGLSPNARQWAETREVNGI